MAGTDRSEADDLIDWSALAEHLPRAGLFAVVRHAEARQAQLPRLGRARRPEQNVVDLAQVLAAERAGVKGDLPDRGFTRIVAVGESLFLDNAFIEEAGNREFARCAVNWLLDQTQVLQGVGPQTVNEYKLLMTRGQLTSVEWLFLAGIPGVILLLGGIVWLRRRH